MTSRKAFCAVSTILLLPACIFAQSQITSRFYFPGIVGINFETDNKQTEYQAGAIITTAMEYRPNEGTPFFYRFNYDNVTTKYSAALANIPTNVTNGTFHRADFTIGAGYRKKFGRLGSYILLQAGTGAQSYDRIIGLAPDYATSQVTLHSPSLKLTAGFEYYIVPHFALIIEPAFYKNDFNYNHVPLNNNQATVSIGFTTTLF